MPCPTLVELPVRMRTRNGFKPNDLYSLMISFFRHVLLSEELFIIIDREKNIWISVYDRIEKRTRHGGWTNHSKRGPLSTQTLLESVVNGCALSTNEVFPAGRSTRKQIGRLVTTKDAGCQIFIVKDHGKRSTNSRAWCNVSREQSLKTLDEHFPPLKCCDSDAKKISDEALLRWMSESKWSTQCELMSKKGERRFYSTLFLTLSPRFFFYKRGKHRSLRPVRAFTDLARKLFVDIDFSRVHLRCSLVMTYWIEYGDVKNDRKSPQMNRSFVKEMTRWTKTFLLPFQIPLDRKNSSSLS